ncbi:MAG: hypothetical protein P8Y26_00490 [Gemmatimonadales bacterium]
MSRKRPDKASVTDEIVRYLRDKAGRPLRPQEIARGLGIRSKERYARFKQGLEELERSGRVVRQRKGRYAVPDNLNLVSGSIQVTRSGDAFLLSEGDLPDVFIPSRERNTAVAGDRALVRVEHRRRRKNPEGRVIRILERARSQIVGVYRKRHSYGFVATQEPRLDVEVFVPPGAEADAEHGQVVVVSIEDWGEGGPGPSFPPMSSERPIGSRKKGSGRRTWRGARISGIGSCSRSTLPTPRTMTMRFRLAV